MNELKNLSEIATHRLAGYLDAVLSLNGCFRDSRATVSLQCIDPDHISRDIEKLYCSKYELTNKRIVHSWLAPLGTDLSKWILADPFGATELSDNENLANTREEVVSQVLKYIRLVTDGFSNKIIYKYDLVYHGSPMGEMFVFPMPGKSLVLRFQDLKAINRGSEHLYAIPTQLSNAV